MKKKAVGVLAGLLMVGVLAPSASAADQTTVVIPIPGTGCVVEVFVTTRYPLSSYVEVRCPWPPS